ncbi:MFS general substrate transporter [Roridomyces roridus]|uniref:MFS general substrate transporter n=1 Tax=Roridomyces roridus TaxID=1738132 RepID=A0AAD7C8V2_9AGAR|nr:MFS general substrate transporter [Roridomyces roridus]
MGGPVALDDGPREDEAPPQRPAWKSVLLVLTCTLAMILNTASTNGISIFFPVIGADLDVAEELVQWLVSAFSLSSGCFLLLFGRLADLYGRKKMYVGGTLYMGILHVGCGFTHNITTLFVLRGLQGLGAAAFIPACLGILAHAFPPSRARSAAFATFSAGAPIGGTIGTQLGAVLTQYTTASWRSTFYLLAGISLLCTIGGLLLIDADLLSTETDRRVDWLGAFLVTVGLVFVIFVLSQGSLASNGWKTGYIIALLIVGVLFIALFIAWQYHLEKSQSAPENRHPPPLMKLSMWTRAKGKFAVVQIIAFLQWSSFLTWNFWAQLYYENYLQLSPVHTALRLLPMTIAGLSCNLFVMLVVSRMPLVVLISCGTLLTGLAGLLFAIILPSAPYWAYGFPAAIASVCGADFVFAAGTLFIAKVSLPHEQSLAGGLFQTLTQFGTAFGLAISTIPFDSIANSSESGGGQDGAPLAAYQAAQWTAFGFAMFCTVLAVLFLRGVGAVGTDERRKEEDVEGTSTPGNETVVEKELEVTGT